MAIFPQTSYSALPSNALAGLLADARYKHTDSKTAQDVTPFGVAVTNVVGQPDQCRLPIANGTVIADDAGTFTAGDLSVTINGQTVTITFSADKATSMALMATALEALDFVSTAAYSSPDMTIVGEDNVNIVVSSFDVSAITGNMTLASITATSTDTILGIVQRGTIQAGESRVSVNDRVVFTLSGDVLNTSDEIDGLLNGVATSTVTYATSEAVTMQLIADSFKTIAGVASVAIDTTLRTITVSNNPGLPINTASLVVTDNALASVAPTFAAVLSAQGVGINQNQAQFVPTELPPILAQGSVWMQCEEAMDPADDVYVRIKATTSNAIRGRIRTDADSGTAVAWSAAKVVGDSETDPNGQRIVQVTINLP